MAARPTPAPRDIAALHRRAIRDLPWLAGRLSLDALTGAVTRSVAHRFQDDPPDPAAVSGYVRSLHATDLGLAVVCERGDETGWEHMVRTFRPGLHRAATVLTGDASAGQELADTIWAELYGIGHTRASLEPGAPRRSLLRHFHGRSRLSTWLRSVLSQRHVDAIRARRKTESLDEERPSAAAARAVVMDAPDPDRARRVRLFQDAVHDAVRTLDPGERLRLSYYYGQGLTLAQIGRLTGEHEATVSRTLTRTRRRLRARVEQILEQRHRMTPDDIAVCCRQVVTDPSVDLGTVIET